MNISEILGKVVNGEEVTAADKEKLRLELDNVERMGKLVSSWVVPGSSVPYIRDLKTSNVRIDSGEIQLGSGTPGDGFSGVRIAFPAFTYDGQEWNLAGIDNDVLQVGIRASDGLFIAGEGHVIIGDGGILLVADAGGSNWITFRDESNSSNLYGIAAGVGSMEFQTLETDGSIIFRTKMTNASTPYTVLREDPTTDNRVLFNVGVGAAGGIISLDSEISMRARSGSGFTYFQMAPTVNAPPTPSGGHFHVYTRGSKFVIQFEDAGTVRYKYLDLTGTGVTWVATTTPP